MLRYFIDLVVFCQETSIHHCFRGNKRGFFCLVLGDWRVTGCPVPPIAGQLMARLGHFGALF